MKKSAILGGILFSLFLLVIFYQPSSVLAAEGECHLENCLVPAPTILFPDQQGVTVSNKLELVGLTWRRTIVKVYLDGVELPGVIHHDHEDYYAGFYVQAAIKPGQHYLYTIAHSEKPGWFDQSKESTYIYFTVKAPAPIAASTPQPRTLPVPDPVEEKVDTDSTPPDYLNQAEDSATGTAVSVEVVEGNIEGGVSVEATKVDQNNLSADNNSDQIQVGQSIDDQNTVATELQPAGEKDDLTEVLAGQFDTVRINDTAKRNRLIGLGVLAILVAGFLIGRWASVNSIKNQFLKKSDDQLPPAPQPPRAGSTIIDPINDQLNNPTIDIIAKDEPKDYWGIGGPTPYTPYPLDGEVKKDNGGNTKI